MFYHSIFSRNYPHIHNIYSTVYFNILRVFIIMYYHHVFWKNKTLIFFCLGKRTKSKRDGLFLLANSAIFQGLNCKHGTKMPVPVRIHVRLLSGNQLVSRDSHQTLYFHFVHGTDLPSNQMQPWLLKKQPPNNLSIVHPAQRSASLRGERRGAPRKEAEHCWSLGWGWSRCVEAMNPWGNDPIWQGTFQRVRKQLTLIFWILNTPGIVLGSWSSKLMEIKALSIAGCPAASWSRNGSIHSHSRGNAEVFSPFDWCETAVSSPGWIYDVHKLSY